ncbi:hypothetical protein HPB48_014188 [Haemaphysalis longicornis]|uniref:peptidylprolyl isomerase n=1 Tax=Haemaphysalis longicornis TaxID=44386 RepID=A0A9J6F9W7_HAELO|nr:hypothetical protein HPB48_014188 [Haemaphysalis longicornis]
MGNSKVFLDVAAGGEKLGHVIMELHTDVVPKTAENFRALCTGEKGFRYKRSTFHSVIPTFMCHGSDFTNHNGTGGKSICGNKFKDENTQLKHTGPGVSPWLTRSRTPTGSSSSSPCMAKTRWLDGEHVAFGSVVEGMEVVKKVEAYGSESEKTSKKIPVGDCGQLSTPGHKALLLQGMQLLSTGAFTPGGPVGHAQEVLVLLLQVAQAGTLAFRQHTTHHIAHAHHRPVVLLGNEVYGGQLSRGKEFVAVVLLRGAGHVGPGPIIAIVQLRRVQRRGIIQSAGWLLLDHAAAEATRIFLFRNFGHFSF